ncbi:MAG: alpha/beta hydrolase [Parabacteroides sp.]|nr:alpha/beta hydrolase [Parabacteroides sp.]
MNKTWLSLLLMLVSVAAAATGYAYKRNVPYREAATDEYADKMCRLDIAYRAEVKNAPVVVWFHGGGLTGGSREVPSQLLTEGMVVVGVEYRLSPHVQTMEIVDDAAAAIAWVFDHIAQYGGNPSSIYIAGHSAGGYLVDMVGLDKTLLARYGQDADRLAGIIPFSGQVITHFETRNRRGLNPLQPTIDETAPLYHVRKDCPPILLLSGDREMELYGRYEETAYFYRLFRLLGHPDVTLYELGGFDHGTMRDAAFPLAVRFIREHEERKSDK